MEKKTMIIIGVIVVIVAILGIVFATGALNKKEAQTPFETDFMSGAFIGNVEKGNTNQSYIASYTDKQHNITYNITTMDNASALMEIYKFQGVQGPDQRKYNGNDWNIYFAEAMPNVNNSTTLDKSKPMGIIICECQKESQGYIIYGIFDTKNVNFTLNTFGDAYKVYMEPLLKGVNLKHSDNVPSVHDQFGLSKDDFYKQIDLIHQIEAGNTSALRR